MRWTDRPRGFAAALAGLGLLVALAAATGIAGRATYGAQVTADEPQYLLTALSLYEDGNLDIADELAAERWRAFHEAQLPEQTRPLDGGRRISPHDPLLPLLLALPMGLGGWVAAKVALAVLSGLTAAVTAWLAVRRFAVPATVALPLVGVFWLSAPLAAYGHQVYPEMAAALAVVVGVGGLAAPRRRGAPWITCAAIVALPWLAVKYTPVAAVLAIALLVVLLRDGRRSPAVVAAGLFALAGVAFVGVHLAIWDGVTAYAAGDHFVGGEFTAVGGQPNYVGRSARLLGLLVDREFGLAAWQPAWLAAPLALLVLLRRRTPGTALLVAPITAGWLTATFVALTMNGYWFPGRQVIVVLPLAVVGIGVVASQARWFGTAVIAVGALGMWSYTWLTIAVLRRRVTWIVDFMAVDDPWYRLWSAVLPAYRFPSAGVWVRHAVWIALLAVGAVLALRATRPPSDRAVPSRLALGRRLRAGRGPAA